MNTVDMKQTGAKISVKQQQRRKSPGLTGGALMKRLSADPFTDWAIIVASAIFVSLCLVAVGVSVYLDTGTRLSIAPVVNPAASESSFNPDRLTQVVSEFAGRAQTAASLIKGYSATQDPSLP